MKRITEYLILLFFLVGCGKDEEAKIDRCNLAPNCGRCFAYFPKYYFDKEEGKCKEFIWGGCEGVVPFNTLEECKQCLCQKPSSDN